MGKVEPDFGVEAARGDQSALAARRIDKWRG